MGPPIAAAEHARRRGIYRLCGLMLAMGLALAAGCGDNASTQAPDEAPAAVDADLRAQRAAVAEELVKVESDLERVGLELDRRRDEAGRAHSALRDDGEDSAAQQADARAQQSLADAQTVHNKLEHAADLLRAELKRLDKLLGAKQ